MYNIRIKSKFVLGACSLAMIGTIPLPAFAVTHSELSQSPLNAVRNQEYLSLNIHANNSNEIDFTVNNNGNTFKAIAHKGANCVTTEFYANGKLALTNNTSLEKAIKFGDTQKSNANKKGNSGVLPRIIPIGGGGQPLPAGDYAFDGLAYAPQSQWIPYAHPDKNFYNISPYYTWSMTGNESEHIQINQYDSNSILQTPAWAIGSGIGALVGAFVSKNLTGSVIGAVIGGALGGYYGGQVQRIADENGCIWFAIDNNPQLVNLSSSWSPMWYLDIRYIEVGPFSKTNYYYYEGGAVTSNSTKSNGSNSSK